MESAALVLALSSAAGGTAPACTLQRKEWRECIVIGPLLQHLDQPLLIVVVAHICLDEFDALSTILERARPVLQRQYRFASVDAYLLGAVCQQVHKHREELLLVQLWPIPNVARVNVGQDGLYAAGHLFLDVGGPLFVKWIQQLYGLPIQSASAEPGQRKPRLVG